MKTIIHNALIVAAVSAVLLAGCGGGGSGGTSSSVTPVATASTGYFVDAPVSGLGYQAGSLSGATSENGAFQFREGDSINFKVGAKVNLGAASGKGMMSPLDLVPAHADDRIVQAMASLLQSLDADGNHENGIQLTPAMIALLEAELGGGNIDFTVWDEMSDTDLAAALGSLEQTLLAVQSAAASDGDDDTDPVYVPPDEAGEALLANLAQENLFVKNVSKTPEADSDKAGMDVLDISVPAHAADGTALDGEVQPLIVSYSDGVGPNGEEDPFVAMSFDNGQSWARTNLFRKAGREMQINHRTFYATSDGPSMHLEGNYVLVSWISTFCPGAPDYAAGGGIDPLVPNPAAELLGDPEPDDGFAHDWFQVLGPQGTVTYYFDNGSMLTNPYYCVWAVRGVVDDVTGEVLWRVPEQITSGTRDAKIVEPAGVEDMGFGLTWQEDPEGLLPGEGEGPGVGWSGATTHHKTDVWYSSLGWSDFEAIDGTEDVDGETRPKVAHPFAVPVAVSDNDACRIDANSGNIPDYCNTALASGTPFCVSTQEVEIKLGTGETDIGTFCVTENGSVLDGDTGASRPNLHFADILDGTGAVVGARALLMYEESKGLCEEGKGCPDAPYDTGKFVMYHHMPDFLAPQMVAQGDILSEPVQYASFDPLEGTRLTPEEYCSISEFCEPGDPLYENARRERFVVNSDPTHEVKLVVIYKQGYYNQGERADIFMRRAVGGYDIENFSPDMCVSCVTPVDPITLEPISDYEYVPKVEEWEWTTDNVNDESWFNPYDDARSLRAKLDGDRLLIGYAWTPNWMLATTLGGDGYFKDHFDFMVRRSFQSAAVSNEDVLFDAPVNTSNLPNNQESVVEPRIAEVPDSILECSANDAASCVIAAGAPEGSEKFVVTYCTAANVERFGPDGQPVHAPGLDCFYSWSADNGETFVATDEDGDGDVDFACLACEKDLEEVEPEVVLTADGMIMHAAWVANGELDESGSDMQNGSDAWYGQFSLAPEEEVTE